MDKYLSFPSIKITQAFRITLAVLIFCLLAGILHAQEDEVISVDSSVVVLNAAVLDASGHAVEGLKPEQFRVFEDGNEQNVSFFQAEETPFAAVILIDTSGSMETRISLARSAAIKFLDGLRPSDNTSIYTFDSKVKQLQEFSNSSDITEHIFDIKAYGMTVLNDAIYEAARVLSKRPEKRKAIIVLSDGEDTQSKRSADKALKAALAVDATIYSVDMSSVEDGNPRRAQNIGILKNFAEKTGGIFVPAGGGTVMRDTFKRIVDELSSQYTIGYQPTNTKKDGKWRSLELRISRPNLTIRTRKGYNAPPAK
jgi:Ca-activated chloride channel family protein